MGKELFTRKESKRYPGLFVKKYTRRVFYDNLWHENDDLLEARGHVELEDGTVVVRPFTKIFNRGENGTDIDRDRRVIAVRKVNGFMACATYVPEVNDVVISTTGSLDSDFVGYAADYINEHVRKVIADRFDTYGGKVRETFMFEIVHKDDPHIIPEQCGAYLIGVRRVDDVAPYVSNGVHENQLDMIARVMGVMRPQWGEYRFDEVVQFAKQCKHEGYVVYDLFDGKSLKIKSPYYLALKAAARKKDILALAKEHIDEEFYPLVDHLKSLGEAFSAKTEQERLDYMRNWLVENYRG